MSQCNRFQTMSLHMWPLFPDSPLHFFSYLSIFDCALPLHCHCVPPPLTITYCAVSDLAFPFRTVSPHFWLRPLPVSINAPNYLTWLPWPLTVPPTSLYALLSIPVLVSKNMVGEGEQFSVSLGAKRASYGLESAGLKTYVWFFFLGEKDGFELWGF